MKVLKKMPGLCIYIKNVIKGKLYYGNITLGKTTKIKSGSNIRTFKTKNGKEKIQIGSHLVLHNNSHIVARGGEVIIGENCRINYNFILVCFDKVHIGKDCAIGPNVCIYDHDHNFNENGLYPGFKTGQIIIEDNCWIGAGCTILRGTHIGKNCVIGAGTVVKGDIPSNSLVTSDRGLVIKQLEKR